MSAPGQWLEWFLEEDDAWKFAIDHAIKTKPGSKARRRWHALGCAIDARRRESLKNFREECARGLRDWDGCDAWFEVHQ